MANDKRYYFDLRLAANIRAARIAAGLAQRDIAERLGVHQNQYQRLERGRHRISAYDLVCVAEIIGVPVAKLIPEMAWNDGTFEAREVEA